MPGKDTAPRCSGQWGDCPCSSVSGAHSWQYYQQMLWRRQTQGRKGASALLRLEVALRKDFPEEVTLWLSCKGRSWMKRGGTGIPGTGKSMGKASRKLEWADEPRCGLLLWGVKHDVEREGWQEVAGHRSCLWGQRRDMVGNLRFVVCSNRIATVYGTSSKCQQYTEKRV